MRGFGIASVAALATLLVQGGPSRSVSADERGRQLPDDCSSGELVVYSAFGEFECVPASEALRLPSCRSGDFLTVEYGTLKCVGREESSSASHALLPSCPSGASLVSEGFGEWDCGPAVH